MTLKTLLHLNSIDGIQNYDPIFKIWPVARLSHLTSLWIDTTRRTIKHLDSYFQGGALFANAMKAYIKDFETPIGQKQHTPSTCVKTTHRKSHEDATHVYVPRQQESDDCSVYVCMFSDLISQAPSI